MKVNVKFDALRSFYELDAGEIFYSPEDRSAELFMCLGIDYFDDNGRIVNAISLTTGVTTFFEQTHEVTVVDDLEIRRCENNQ